MARQNRPRKHYGKWRIRWLDAQGKRQSEVYEKYEDAKLALERHSVEAQEIRRGLRPRLPAPKTFLDLSAYWLEHRAPHKRSGKDDASIIRKHLNPAFGDLKLAEVTVERADRFTAERGLSVKTLHNVLTLLITLLNLAVELEWLSRRPRIRKPRLPDQSHDFNYLRTEEDIGRFLRAARERGENVFALYATAVFTGMRAGELAGLQWDDVDLERRLITVQHSYTGPTKAGYVRFVPVLDPLLPVLRAWRLRCPGPIVFPNRAGKMHGPSARVFQETLHEVLRAAGFAEVQRGGKQRSYISFHGLRHSFASMWMARGGDLFRLQRIGGWKSYAMVQRYAHLAPDMFAEDYARLGTALPTETATVLSLSSAISEPHPATRS